MGGGGGGGGGEGGSIRGDSWMIRGGSVMIRGDSGVIRGDSGVIRGDSGTTRGDRGAKNKPPSQSLSLSHTHLVKVRCRVDERRGYKPRVHFPHRLAVGKRPHGQQPRGVEREQKVSYREQLPHGRLVDAIASGEVLGALEEEDGFPTRHARHLAMRRERAHRRVERGAHKDLTQLGAVEDLEGAADGGGEEGVAAVANDQARLPVADQTHRAVRHQQRRIGRRSCRHGCVVA